MLTFEVCSSPVDVPQIRYGFIDPKSSTWTWLDVANPISRYSDKVINLVSKTCFLMDPSSLGKIFVLFCHRSRPCSHLDNLKY